MQRATRRLEAPLPLIAAGMSEREVMFVVCTVVDQGIYVIDMDLMKCEIDRTSADEASSILLI